MHKNIERIKNSQKWHYTHVILVLWSMRQDNQVSLGYLVSSYLEK